MWMPFLSLTTSRPQHLKTFFSTLPNLYTSQTFCILLSTSAPPVHSKSSTWTIAKLLSPRAHPCHSQGCRLQLHAELLWSPSESSFDEGSCTSLWAHPWFRRRWMSPHRNRLVDLLRVDLWASWGPGFCPWWIFEEIPLRCRRPRRQYRGRLQGTWWWRSSPDWWLASQSSSWKNPPNSLAPQSLISSLLALQSQLCLFPPSALEWFSALDPSSSSPGTLPPWSICHWCTSANWPIPFLALHATSPGCQAAPSRRWFLCRLLLLGSSSGIVSFWSLLASLSCWPGKRSCPSPS